MDTIPEDTVDIQEEDIVRGVIHDIIREDLIEATGVDIS